MDNQEKELDYNLDDIMQQLHEASTQEEAQTADVAVTLEHVEAVEEEPAFEGADFDAVAQASQLFSAAGSDAISDNTDPLPDISAAQTVSDNTDPLPQLPPEAAEVPEAEKPAPAAEATE